jgi:ABC-type Mn2+/Zn2+ transport system ATPase subunit
VETALELVNMKQFMHRATHTLSGGQRQRVAIAGALMPLLQQADWHVVCCIGNSVWCA